MKTTRQLYCQYLLSSQINYTCTNLAEHFENLDHNSIYRYLKTEKLSPRLLWEKVKDTIVYSPRGAIIFDDTVLDKSHSFAIEGVRRQYSGTEHAVIKGIGLVNCVYYNPDVDRFWVLDYRVFDPDRDGKTKLEDVSEMLDQLAFRAVEFCFVLMDSWYATTALMTRLVKEEKFSIARPRKIGWWMIRAAKNHTRQSKICRGQRKKSNAARPSRSKSLPPPRI